MFPGPSEVEQHPLLPAPQSPAPHESRSLRPRGCSAAFCKRCPAPRATAGALGSPKLCRGAQPLVGRNEPIHLHCIPVPAHSALRGPNAFVVQRMRRFLSRHQLSAALGGTKPPKSCQNIPSPVVKASISPSITSLANSQLHLQQPLIMHSAWRAPHQLN